MYCCAVGLASALSGKMPTHRVSFQLWVVTLSRHVCPATPMRTSSRIAVRTFLHTERLLGLQASGGPGTGLEEAVRLRRQRPRPAGAVVDSPFSFDPQLDRFRPEVVAAPVGRARDDDLQVGVGPGVSGQRRAEALGSCGNRFL